MHPLPLLAAFGLLFAGAAQAQAPVLGLPIACAMNTDCFIQQYPDLDPTPAASDPWCGRAAYDGHDGTDFRLRAMPDIAAPGTAVIAAAAGTVKGTRDGVPDRLVASDADRQAIAGIECGNGLVIDMGEGWEAQYCHMRQGSIAVQSGDVVGKGDPLGFVGASGLVQFPHLHLSIRHNGADIDPTTGRSLDSGCGMEGDNIAPLWDPAIAPSLVGWQGQVLDMGFAGAPIEHAALTSDGPPPAADAGSENFVGWAWFIKLRKGDIVALRLSDSSGSVIAESKLDPLDADKADYSAYAGKRGAPPPGTYELVASVTRDGAEILQQRASIRID